MKKVITLSLLLMVVCASAFARAVEGPDAVRHAHREEMKKIKAAQRETKAAKASRGDAEAKKAPGFWEREGERSGLGSSGNRAGAFFKNLNPVPFFKEQQERYNARKTASGK